MSSGIPKQHFFLIVASTLLAGFSLLSIVSFTDPYTSSKITHIFFYASLLLTILGVATLGGILLRNKYLPGMYINHMAASFRQALFIAILVILLLLLQAGALLYWWVGIPLVLIFIFIELLLNMKV